MSADNTRQLFRLLDPLDALRDAMACRELDAFDSPDAASETAAGAACDLATALGWCRLLDRKIDNGLDGVLRLDMAKAAAIELRRRLEHWTEDASTLEERCRSATEPIEAQDLCLGLLHLRMDAWAAQVAIDEAYMDTWDMPDDGASGQLESAVSELNEAFEAFDEELRSHEDLLCVAAETPLLDNWRSLLHPAYGECLPWWLDKTLEDTAKRNAEEAVAAQPALDTSGRTMEAGLTDAREKPVLRPLQETMEDLAQAIRRLFRPEARLANAAASDEKKEVKVLLDSQEDLGPIRGILYQMPNGDLRLALSSSDETVADQTYEVIVEEQTRPTVTFRKSSSGRWFGQVKIPRDQLPEVGLSNLSFRLKPL